MKHRKDWLAYNEHGDWLWATAASANGKQWGLVRWSYFKRLSPAELLTKAQSALQEIADAAFNSSSHRGRVGVFNFPHAKMNSRYFKNLVPLGKWQGGHGFDLTEVDVDPGEFEAELLRLGYKPV